jgi:mono/diheme cytochrome c family protein
MDQDKTLQDVLETVQFIKEHGSTKEEMHAMGNGLREEMHAMGNGLREEMHAMGNGLREEMLSMEKRL